MGPPRERRATVGPLPPRASHSSGSNSRVEMEGREGRGGESRGAGDARHARNETLRQAAVHQPLAPLQHVQHPDLLLKHPDATLTHTSEDR
jgi:hypothetical protein